MDDDNIRRYVSEYLHGNPNNYPPIGTWDVHRVTNMSSLFHGSNFNERLNWNTSNVTDMNHMFHNCKSFNQPLTFRGRPWNTSNVTNMRSMFGGCIQFNQPVEFNTSKVVSMCYMFDRCVWFNQPVLFDTRRVKDFLGMFSGCTRLNQPIHFNAVNAERVDSMFEHCKSLLYRPILDNISPSITKDMFNGVDFERSLKIHGIPQLPYSITRSIASFLGRTRKSRVYRIRKK